MPSTLTLPKQRPDTASDGSDGLRRQAQEGPVTVLFSRRIQRGRRADYETWAHGVTEAARHFPGHVGASVLSDPGSRDYHVLYTFADRASLQSWLDSEERRRWMAELNAMTETQRGLQEVTGLETWFKLPGSSVPTMKPPRRWKMWLVSIVAVYPLVLLFQVMVAPRISGLPLPLRALAYPVVLLTLMTFVVMPVLTRLLRRWLAPDRRLAAADIGRG